MTGFGIFDKSTRKRVLDLLESGDLKLGQVVIKRVALVELGVTRDKDITHSSFRRELKTYWFSCNRGAM